MAVSSRWKPRRRARTQAFSRGFQAASFAISPQCNYSALKNTMTGHSRKTVFYSWQSDLPAASNLQLIRSQLRAAISNVEEQQAGLSISLDEATRDLPGSPHIPTAITDRFESPTISFATSLRSMRQIPMRESAQIRT